MLKLKTPLQMERRFGLALTLASRIFRPAVIRRTFYRLSGRFTLCRVRSLAVALAGACCSWLTDVRQPVHHWRPTNSNPGAVYTIICFQPVSSDMTVGIFVIW
jgi:hypothetical protein